MQTSAETYLSKIIHNNALRAHIRQSLAVLSLLVVLTVFWGLKLTGITMAGEAFCGKEEHVHTDECPLRNLTCELEECEAHMHSEACLVKELICQQEETEEHHHTDACLTQILVCKLPEQEAHTHTDDCLIKKLTCTLQEQEGHLHSDDCLSKELTCGLEVIPSHTHDSGCYHKNLVCSALESDGHFHGPDCFEPFISCGLDENEDHKHDDSCITMRQTCQLPESEGHHHSDTCYQDELICTQEETEGHNHSDACYTIGSDYVCNKEEIEAHAHTDDCYTLEPGYGCGLEEMDAHLHTEDCFTTEADNFCCGLEETGGHIHSDTCWRFGIGFGCGLTEAEGHTHTEDCITEETEFGCQKISTPGHIHTDECYDILEYCPLEEHTHDISCYSDISADLETSDDWEMSMAELIRSPRTSENILMVAQSQLGCMESQRNFQVDEFGIRRGITRFGQWYNNPYGDWSAMFVSFCLHYAGVEDVPFNAGVESMRLEWETAGLYRSAAEFSPVPGHLLFLDKDLDSTADSVAIIASFDETGITVIEGDVEIPVTYEETAEAAEETTDEENTESIPLHGVSEVIYQPDDPAIFGYGLVPFEPELMMMAPRATTVVAKTIAYKNNIFTGTRTFLLYTQIGNDYYAIDGSGNMVQVYIDKDNNISCDTDNPNSLLWMFTAASGNNNYQIRNSDSRRYLLIENNSVTSISEGTSNLTTSGNGATIRNGTLYLQPNTNDGKFQASTANNAAVYQFGVVENYVVWLDGTDGTMMSYAGSPNEKYLVPKDGTLKLPNTWKSPTQYNYKLRGWYDVINGVYYAPGEEVTVTENMVFYADWVAASYNIGQYNSRVANTDSTSDFVTTRMFDYNALFNVLSQRVDVTVDASGHTESWSLLTTGTNDYNGASTLDFIFRDWDNERDLSYPSGTNGEQNTFSDSRTVYPGLYTEQLHNLLFSTSNSFNPNTKEGVIGKEYLGTADYLFQFMDDPNDPHYGYYYYDSERNAAAYNKDDGRFYVYEFLERTTSSASSSGEGKYSDFLPLNSPYGNTNGNFPDTYTYDGLNGEYANTTHYLYEATDGSSPVSTNFMFGMSIDINFYLPNKPGSETNNLDLYGKQMHFEFSGDDDVWVLVDGKLVLDLGGIHGIESGDINFSTGAVTVNGQSTGSVTYLAPGDHKLTILYLERGSSQSNCAIYFNLAPQYSFRIQKEDVLTQNVLNGAQFSVFTDKNCTQAAALWTSKASHDRGDAATNVFTVVDGAANMWGLSAGNTYYIKESKPPDDPNYSGPNGIIEITLDKTGNASYNVTMLPETDGSVSPGFTVHGFKIDEVNQTAQIVATNAPKWAKETTSIQVMKHWNDGLDHAGESVTVYLTTTDPDGTVRRLQELVLSSENNWTGKWENLMKYRDENKTPVIYGVEEAYTSGYYSTTQTATGSFEISKTVWSETNEFKNGEIYLLKNNDGKYLSTLKNAEDTGFMWVSQSTALMSNLAQWTATVSGNTILLKNRAGQIITFWYGNNNPTDFFAYNKAEESNNRKQNLTVSEYNEKFLLSYGTSYLSSTLNSSNKFGRTTNPTQALQLTPITEVTETSSVPIKNQGYLITNTPLAQETSLTVQKYWDYGNLYEGTEHLKAQVTVKLLANGRDTGRTVTLSLKNGWQDTFRGLPYVDNDGNVIQYTVKESWDNSDWIPQYGEITVTAADLPTYSTTITNINRWGTGGPELPSTGTAARMMYTYCGFGIMLGSLVCGIVSRRRRGRRRM